MKNNRLFYFLFLSITFPTYGQDSTFIKINEWFTENKFAIRQTFDGSKNENKPASFTYQEDHESPNDFLIVDIALKISELELLKNSNAVLIFYPKIEWHKSTNETDKKNKLDGGINFEYYPLGLEKNAIVPWFQGTSSFKRNFIDEVYEKKLAFQLSLSGKKQFLPGSNIRDSKDNFRARYYPYVGIEYNHLPDLISKGVTEEFSAYFLRFFAETWILPQTLQFNLDATYREILSTDTSLRKSLPILISSLYLYPGKQESFGIGFEYKYGYDNTAKFQLIQISSLKLSWKI